MRRKRNKVYLLPIRCETCDQRLLGVDVTYTDTRERHIRVIVCPKCDRVRR